MNDRKLKDFVSLINAGYDLSDFTLNNDFKEFMKYGDYDFEPYELINAGLKPATPKKVKSLSDMYPFVFVK